MMTSEQVQEQLAKPFEACDVEWRVKYTHKDTNNGIAVAYITSRAIQKRLDDVVGSFNWKAEYKSWHMVDGKSSQICGLSIYCEERKEWITKCDGAENTEYEPVKGGISDAFKRAAVHWGIGRYLYGMEGIWVEVEESGKSYKISPSGLNKLNKKYLEVIKSMSNVDSKSNMHNSKHSPVKQTTTKLEFDFVVKSVKTKGTFQIIQLHEPKTGAEVVAYKQGVSSDIANGICLKDVKLTKYPSNGNSPEYNSIDSYKIVA